MHLLKMHENVHNLYVDIIKPFQQNIWVLRIQMESKAMY
jgi:hypothetical protein